MNLTIAAVFGIAGGLLGLLIPRIIHEISLNKCRKKGVAPVIAKNYGSVFRLTLCILNSAAWAFAGYRMGNFLTALLISILFSMALVVTFIDLRIRIIPNELVLAMIIAGAAFQAVNWGLAALLISLLCMVGMMILFSATAGITGFGMVGAGDVKLAGAMGAVLGYPNILAALLIMCAAIVIYSSVGLITKKLNMRSTFAFAPFMMLGMAFSLARIVIG